MLGVLTHSKNSKAPNGKKLPLEALNWYLPEIYFHNILQKVKG
jgi:hypothetical protein